MNEKNKPNTQRNKIKQNKTKQNKKAFKRDNFFCFDKKMNNPNQYQGHGHDHSHGHSHGHAHGHAHGHSHIHAHGHSHGHAPTPRQMVPFDGTITPEMEQAIMHQLAHQRQHANINPTPCRSSKASKVVTGKISKAKSGKMMRVCRKRGSACCVEIPAPQPVKSCQSDACCTVVVDESAGNDDEATPSTQ